MSTPGNWAVGWVPRGRAAGLRLLCTVQLEWGMGGGEEEQLEGKNSTYLPSDAASDGPKQNLSKKPTEICECDVHAAAAGLLFLSMLGGSFVRGARQPQLWPITAQVSPC